MLLQVLILPIKLNNFYLYLHTHGYEMKNDTKYWYYK